MLCLGFLNCFHFNERKTLDALWGIINPNISETVSKSRVEKILAILIYYSTELPNELIKNDENNDKALKDYAQEVFNNGEKVLEQVKLNIPDKVSKTDLEALLPASKWYSSVKIRGFVCPDKA